MSKQERLTSGRISWAEASLQKGLTKTKGEDYVTQIVDYCMYRSIDVVGRL